MRKAAFLDRDNTIIDNTGFINTVEEMQNAAWIPGAIEGLKALQDLGYQLHVVTNQGGVAYGYLTEITLAEQHIVLWERLQKEGINLASIKSCKHHPAADCECRKPKAGLILALAKRFPIDLANSIMIGDQDTDVQAGMAAGLPNSYKLGPEYSWADIIKYLPENREHERRA